MLQHFSLHWLSAICAAEVSGSSSEPNAFPVFPRKRCYMCLNIFLGKGEISVHAPVSS